MNVPKRTFTPFGLLRLQNPQQRPANGASSNEQPSEPARIVDVERQKYLTPNSRVRLPVFLVEDGLITDAQVRRLREKRMSGKTLAAAAAAAGMSERTARHWQSGALPSTAKAPRTWRTREDPFAGVWESEVVPQLVADTEGRLQVLTLFTWLCRRHPGRFQAGQLRTLQRRVRDWRVQYGPDREVYFGVYPGFPKTFGLMQ